MVLGVKLMGKPTTWEKSKGFGQNQGIVRSSDSSLWGNQQPEKKQGFWTEPRNCIVLGLKPMGKPTTLEKTKILDGTRALYGPRTQAYEETNYLKEKTKVLDRIKAFVWSSDSILWGNQLPEKKNKGFGQNPDIVWSSDSSLWGNQLPEKKQRFWTEPWHCMVLGLKLMGKPTTWEKRNGFGQNQGIVLSSDSTLWGNQLPEKTQRFWIELRHL